MERVFRRVKMAIGARRESEAETTARRVLEGCATGYLELGGCIPPPLYTRHTEAGLDKGDHTIRRDFLQQIPSTRGRPREWNISCGETGLTREETDWLNYFTLDMFILDPSVLELSEHDKGTVGPGFVTGVANSRG
jgi:hypothetical protein